MDNEFVAQIEPGELAQLRQASQALGVLDMQHRLAMDGFDNYWGWIRRKYQVAPDVAYDAATGIFYRPAASAPAHPPEPPARTVEGGGGGPDVLQQPEAIGEVAPSVSPIPSPLPANRQSRRARKRGH